MTLAQIYNVACQAGLQNLQVHLADAYSEEHKVEKVEVGFHDSYEDMSYEADEAAEYIAESAEDAGLSYVEYENRYVTKVLLLS